MLSQISVNPCVLQEWPELGGGTASHAGQHVSMQADQPATLLTAATAAEPAYANGHQHGSLNAASARSTTKPDAAGKLPHKTSSSSPDQRLPATPSPANSHPHSPETPVSGQSSASAGASPAGTPPAAQHQQQLHQTPRSSHRHRRDASAASSDGLHAATQQPKSAKQQQQQQQQQQQGLLQLTAMASSDVQRDPVVHLASRRSSGRVPPPGFSGAVAAPTAAAAHSSQGPRHKVNYVCFAQIVRIAVLAGYCQIVECNACSCIDMTMLGVL